MVVPIRSGIEEILDGIGGIDAVFQHRGWVCGPDTVWAAVGMEIWKKCIIVLFESIAKWEPVREISAGGTEEHDLGKSATGKEVITVRVQGPVFPFRRKVGGVGKDDGEYWGVGELDEMLTLRENGNEVSTLNLKDTWWSIRKD